LQDGTQTHPFKTINAGEAAANTGEEIRVQQGTYRLAASITLKPGVYLHGGYDGGWNLNGNRTTTIISGEGVVRCMSGSNLTSATTIENFTVNNGYATGGSGYGGGLYLINNSSPLINNCVFTSNKANISGGGIYGDHSSMTVSNCAFTSNSAANNYGGGICTYISVSPVIKGCQFTSNSANNNYGGGVCNIQTSAQVMNCIFTSNSAKQGGGLFNHFSADPVITNCVFTGNTTPNFGGGMFNFTSTPEVKNCTFTANTASNGGGIFNFNGSSPVLTNTIVFDNNGTLNFASSTSTPTANYSCIKDGTYAGTNDISVEPMFVNGPAGDVHIPVTSECVDSGSATAASLGLDYLHGYGTNPNGVNGDAGTVDMGYHYTGYTIAAISPLLITTVSPLTNGMDGSPYSVQLVATGGVTPDTWSVKAGSLPLGLTLDASGLLHGTPTTFETTSFTIEVRDSQPVVNDKVFSLTITPPGAAIPLTAGFNLFSIPVIPTDTSISSVIGNQLAGQTAYIYSFSPASGWSIGYYDDTAGAWKGTVTTIDPDKAYWIKITGAVTLEVAGNLSTTDRTIALKGGSANFVGTAYNVTRTMAQTNLSSYITSADRIWGFNNSWNPAIYSGGVWSGGLNTTGFEPGRGYWVIKNSAGDASWDYPKPSGY
jgi:parallel beta-helix repeat protein